MKQTVLLKLNNVPENYTDLSWGCQLDYRHLIENFKATAEYTYLSQKRCSYKTALKKFVKLNNVKEYVTEPFSANKPYHYDDSFKIWYK